MYYSTKTVIPEEAKAELAELHDFKSARTYIIPSMIWAVLCVGILSVITTILDFVGYTYLDWERCSCCSPYNPWNAVEEFFVFVGLASLFGAGIGALEWYHMLRSVNRDLKSRECESFQLRITERHVLVLDKNGAWLLLPTNEGLIRCVDLGSEEDDPRWCAFGEDGGLINSNWSWYRLHESGFGFGFKSDGPKVVANESVWMDDIELFEDLEDPIPDGGVIDAPFETLFEMARKCWAQQAIEEAETKPATDGMQTAT